MKRILCLALVLSCFLCRAQYNEAYRELYEGEVASRMRSHVSELAAAVMEGRFPGSEGEADAADYVSSEFQKYGLQLMHSAEGQVFGLSRANGDTLVSRNVIAIIPGYDKTLRDHYIVIGARLDNLGSYNVSIDGKQVTKIRYGANGNASGLALLIELGKKLSQSSVLLKRSVILAAFGSSTIDNAGSWYFLNRVFDYADKIDAMVNLDMLGTPSRGFYAYNASNVDLTLLLESVEETLQPIVPKVVTMEPVQSDHRSFYAKEIPSVLFTTGMYPEYNTDKDTPSVVEYDGMERVLEYLYNFSLALTNGPKPAFSITADLKKSKVMKDNGVVDFVDCDIPPIFMNNPDPRSFLQRWVYKYLRYPQDALEQGIQGRVLVNFEVDEKGHVGNVRVVKGVYSLLDDEAVRVISASPDWKPGKLNGKKVRTEVSVYVEFRLKERK